MRIIYAWQGPQWLERLRLLELVCVCGGCVCVCARAWICVGECVSEQMDGWGWYWPNSQPLVKKLSSVMVKSPGFQPQLLFQLHHFLTP